jgi:hypothetical protein
MNPIFITLLENPPLVTNLSWFNPIRTQYFFKIYLHVSQLGATAGIS